MSEIPLFSHVRSFDFARGDHGRDLEGERACYVEGVVCAVIPAGERFDTPDPGGFVYPASCDRYAIRVTRLVFGGVEGDPEEIPTWACPPLNGTPTSMGRITNNVEAIK